MKIAKPWAKKFYNSKAWKECRRSYIQSVNGLCETCLEKDDIVPGYILHHTEHLTPNNINDPEVTLNRNKLKYECKECHDKHEGHGVGKKVNTLRNGLEFDSEGNLIKVGE